MSDLKKSSGLLRTFDGAGLCRTHDQKEHHNCSRLLLFCTTWRRRSFIDCRSLVKSKKLQISPGNWSSKERYFLIFSLSYRYEIALNYFSRSNRQQNEKELCESSILLYLTWAWFRFHPKQKIIKRFKTNGISVPFLTSITEFKIQNSRTAPPQSTDSESLAAVAV